MKLNIKRYRQIRVGIIVFVGAMVGSAVAQDNLILAAVAVIVGMVFLALARAKTKIHTDEREKLVREKAAQYTYAIFAPVIGLSAFTLVLFGRNLPYLAGLGQVLAYITFFLILLYSISYYFLNRHYGGRDHEK